MGEGVFQFGRVWYGLEDVYVCVCYVIQNEETFLQFWLTWNTATFIHCGMPSQYGLSSKQRETNAPDKHGRLLKDAAVYLLLILFKHETFCYPHASIVGG